MTEPFRVVIPARFGSSRLPGKPLRLIAGRPMIQHVYERALESGALEIVVATDDARIAKAVESFGGVAMLTSPRHESGTDRLAEVATRCGWNERDIVVNLQGDEPLIDPGLLSVAAESLAARVEAGIATLVTPIHEPADVFDPNIVKAVLDHRGMALYFSRAPIPWVRGEYHKSPDQVQWPVAAPVYRHLGLYAYRVGVLRTITSTAPCALEGAEALEQLRALWLGIRIHATLIEHAPGHGVDTEEDLNRVERLLAAPRDQNRV
ncbi:MAG: 3-deoxy-manno-octulosonate cytidylyltransferase [Thiotrichales bacterium]